MVVGQRLERHAVRARRRRLRVLPCARRTAPSCGATAPAWPPTRAAGGRRHGLLRIVGRLRQGSSARHDSRRVRLHCASEYPRIPGQRSVGGEDAGLAEQSIHGARLLAQVHHRCIDNGVAVDVVEAPVGKSVDEGAPSACRDQSPSMRELKNPFHGPVDFKSKLVSELGALLVVKGNRFDPLVSCLREELNRQGGWRVA